jgi:hypothetical protein
MADTSKTTENGENKRTSTGGVKRITDNDLPMVKT